MKTGTLIARSYIFHGGTIDFLGEASVRGQHLSIGDIASYPAGRSRARLGTKSVMEAFNALAAEALSAGFTPLTVSGVRYSGAKPGAIVSITRRLGPPRRRDDL